jgi:transposase, IS5 family
MSKRHQYNLFLSLDSLVPDKHPYRYLDQVISFSELSASYQRLYSVKGQKGKGVEFGAAIYGRCEWSWDGTLSSGEYCGQVVLQSSLGWEESGSQLLWWFSQVRNSLKDTGLIREVFTFVEASQLVSKLTTWDDRDKAMTASLEKFNHDTASKVAADKQARFDCKGHQKYWFGDQEHVLVAMQSGLINKVAATSAEVTAADGVLHVCPKEKIVVRMAGSLPCNHSTNGYLRIAINGFVTEVWRRCSFR